jgi:hypothetical protein
MPTPPVDSDPRADAENLIVGVVDVRLPPSVRMIEDQDG